MYRLTDSVATDTALNAEGEAIFNALKLAGDDAHPDAHACRLKVALVTVDAGLKLPWDLTREAAKYVTKLGAVAATCALALEEELQVLESSPVVLNDKHPAYDPLLHDPYTLALVNNRLAALRASLAGEPSFQVTHPAREAGTSWPYHTDATALGETYNTASEISGPEDLEKLLSPTYPDAATSFGRWNALRAFAASTGRDAVSFDDAAPEHPLMAEVEASPEGLAGWAASGLDGALTVLTFHVLWDEACAKVAPKIADLAPLFPGARFHVARADRVGVDAVARARKITTFPTTLVFRGKAEVERLEGPTNAVARLNDYLRTAVTPADEAIADALSAFAAEEAGVVEEEAEQELEW